MCKHEGVCPVDSQHRTCNEWLTSSRKLYSKGSGCSTLERFGLSCNGCNQCEPTYVHHAHAGATAKPADGRFAKGLYSAGANREPAGGGDTGDTIRARIVCSGGMLNTGTDGGVPAAVPPGDVLIYTGSYPGYGHDTDAAEHRSEELAKFNTWLGTLPHRQKFVVLGETSKDRHSGLRQEVMKRITNAKVLADTREAIDVDGDGEGELTVWGGHSLPSGFALAASPADILATFDAAHGQDDANPAVYKRRAGKAGDAKQRKAKLHCFHDYSKTKLWPDLAEGQWMPTKVGGADDPKEMLVRNTAASLAAILDVHFN